MLVRSRKDLTFIQPDKFPVCFHCSEDYLHQHGFSRTVPAEQSNNITCIYFQVNISQQLPGTEILNNTIYFKQVMHNFTIQSTDRKFIRLDECKVLSAPYQHARTIAFLPQQGYLPKHEKIKKLVDCYLDANVVPYFYEDDEVAQSCMERRVSQLSGGERRYLEAKLLLLGNAKFVLLDEPFDYLSFHLVDKLIGLIKKHSEEKGIVIADHNYEKVLEVVNRLVLIREGVLMELTDKRGLVEQGYLLDESYL